MSAQIVGQECLFDLPNAGQDKPMDSTTGHAFRRLPDEFAKAEHTSDWWYGVEECIGCGAVADRKGLQITHGVQFDDEGTQHFPRGPGMAESGVCMLMLFTARHAPLASASLRTAVPCWVVGSGLLFRRMARVDHVHFGHAWVILTTVTGVPVPGMVSAPCRTSVIFHSVLGGKIT